MEIKKDDLVHINSSNDLLKPYWKEKTRFLVDSICTIEDDTYATLKFEKNNDILKVVVMGYELVPCVKVLV